MDRRCLFCPNAVDSAEHIWSEWIIEDLKLFPPIKITTGKASTYIAKPDATVECVCRKCNNGWMSILETKNQGPIHAMIHGESQWLNRKDQRKLTRWALLKAMVIDASNPERAAFYNDTEKEQVKSDSGIPIGTLVWLGRFSSQAFYAGGTDIWGEIDEIPKALHGCVTSMIMGNFVLQVLSGHVLPRFSTFNVSLNCKNGAWDIALLDIWPYKEVLQWPPLLSFGERGDNSIADIVNRWKTGTNVG